MSQSWDNNTTTSVNALNEINNNVSDDISKHLISLQARLGFARFKMKQGWEASTLLDVEQLWKQKQRQSINDLPKPRFTQRDIIDKRAYIPSPGARHARAKKSKLVKTYSNPSMNSNKSTLYFHHYSYNKKCQQKKNDSHTIISIDDNNSSSPPSPSNSSICSDDAMNRNNHDYAKEQPLVRNSLDYLSYAIAMTEREEGSSSQPLPDISEMEPNLIEEEEVDAVSPPSSPTTTAAKAIMMFVNNNHPAS